MCIPGGGSISCIALKFSLTTRFILRESISRRAEIVGVFMVQYIQDPDPFRAEFASSDFDAISNPKPLQLQHFAFCMSGLTSPSPQPCRAQNRSEGFPARDIWFLGVMVQGPYQMGRVVWTSPSPPPSLGNSGQHSGQETILGVCPVEFGLR